MVPWRELWLKANIFSDVKPDSADGSVPVSALLFSATWPMRLRLPSDAGMVPVSWLFVR